MTQLTFWKTFAFASELDALRFEVSKVPESFTQEWLEIIQKGE